MSTQLALRTVTYSKDSAPQYEHRYGENKKIFDPHRLNGRVALLVGDLDRSDSELVKIYLEMQRNLGRFYEWTIGVIGNERERLPFWLQGTLSILSSEGKTLDLIAFGSGVPLAHKALQQSPIKIHSIYAQDLTNKSWDSIQAQKIILFSPTATPSSAPHIQKIITAVVVPAELAYQIALRQCDPGLDQFSTLILTTDCVFKKFLAETDGADPLLPHPLLAIASIATACLILLTKIP